MSFNLSMLSQNQINQEFCINSNIRKLSDIVYLSAISNAITTPPTNPSDGDIYIIPLNANGIFANNLNKIAIFHDDNGWEFFTPKIGMLAYVKDTGQFFAFINNKWSIFNSAGGTSNIDLSSITGNGLILNSQTNKLSVSTQVTLQGNNFNLAGQLVQLDSSTIPKLPNVDGSNLVNLTKNQIGLGNVQNVDTSNTTNINEGYKLFFTNDRAINGILNNFAISASRIAIIASDTILQAFGKVQKYFNDLSLVAFSGSYTDLINKPILSSVAFSGSYLNLSNTPNLAAIATSGSASDLSTGTISSTRLPVASATSLGGIKVGSGLTIDNNGILSSSVSQGSGGGSNFTTGDYKHSAQTANHGQWLLCNGTAVSRSTYSTLFALIGISFGSGDGSTTFNLPDFRGRVFGAIGQGNGLTNRVIGQTIGEENHTLTIAEMPAHTHNVGGVLGGTITAGGNYAGSATLSSSSTGGSQAHNNMQPSLFGGNVFIYCG